MTKQFFVRMSVACAALAGLLYVLLRPGQISPEPLAAKAGSISTLERDATLQTDADALLSLFDKMPPVPVYLTDEPRLETGTNTERGAAYTHCFRQEMPVVFFKKIFYQKANRKQLINALKHELTHAWLCRKGQMSVGHGPEFRRKFTAVGGFGN